MPRSNVYRAIVEESDASTGRITVSIPGLAGAGNRFTVTEVGRKKINGKWKVPPVGSIVLVAAEDENLTTLFLIQTYTYDDEIRASDVYGDLRGPVVILARNDSGSPISKGRAVRGALDGDLVVWLASADDPAQMPAIGLAAEDIATNAYGKVAVSGLLEGFNTTALTPSVDIFVGVGGSLVSSPIGLTTAQVVGRAVTSGETGSFLVTVYPPATESGGTGGSGDFSGVFNGTIYASGGNIGGSTSGWVITPEALTSYGGSPHKIVLDGSDGQIYIGSSGGGVYNDASTPFYADATGAFSLGNKLSYNPVTQALNVEGDISSDSGFIGGWEIDSPILTSGSGSNYVALSSGGSDAIWAGNPNPADAPFRVTKSGVLTASSVTMTGNVTATSGKIGNWTVNEDSLQSVGADPITLDGLNGKIYAGNPNWGNTANGFYADSSGKFGLGNNLTWNPYGGASGNGQLILNGQIDAVKAAFAGWTLEPGRLYSGTGDVGNYIELNTEVAADNPGTRIQYATWAGHPNPDLAPFAVRRNGVITRASGSFNMLETNEVIGRLVLRVATGSSMSFGVGVGTTEANNGLWINSQNHWYDTGEFRTGSSNNYLSFTPSTDTLEVSGRILATSGSVANWLISGNTLIAGTGSSTVGLNSTGGSTPAFYAGSATPSSAPFRVFTNGNLVATNASLTNASISGRIVATSGVIGGWNVAPTGASLTNGSSGMVPGSWPIFAGGSDPASAKFRVNDQGELFAEAGTFKAAIDIGTGASSFHVNTQGNVWAGSATYASTSPFSLTNTGEITLYGPGGVVDGLEYSQGTVKLSPGTNDSTSFNLPNLSFNSDIGLVQNTRSNSTLLLRAPSVYIDNTSGLGFAVRVGQPLTGTRLELSTIGMSFWLGIGTTEIKALSMGGGGLEIDPVYGYKFMNRNVGVFSPSSTSLTLVVDNSTAASITSTGISLRQSVSVTGSLTATGQVSGNSYINANSTFTVGSGGAVAASSITLSALNPLTANLGDANNTNQTIVVINNSNGLRRNTSRQLLKTNIIPLTDSPLVNVNESKILASPEVSSSYSAGAYADLDIREVLNITPVLFESLIEEEEGIPMLGFIAEDVMSKFPLAAIVDGDGSPLSWAPSPVVVALVGVIRELDARVEQLEAALA